MQPPKNAIAFLRWFCREDYVDEIEGDLIEVFNKERKQSSRRLHWKFWWRVLKYLRPEFIKPLKNSQTNDNAMLKNYLKIGWRNVVRDKAYSTINIISLSAGMTVALLIGIWTWDELSFNTQFTNHEQLAQIMVNQSHKEGFNTDESIAPPIAEPLRTQFPNEISRQSMMSYEGGRTLQWGNVKLYGNGAWVQNEFTEMFTLKMVSGTRKALEDQSHVLISESHAKAIFGNVDPAGRLVRVDDRFDMVIGGVYQDFERNSSFSGLKVLLPWNHPDNGLNSVTDWSNHSCRLYVQMAPGVTAESLTSKIKNIPTPHVDVVHEELLAHPFDKIHLYDKFENGKSVGGYIDIVMPMGATGFFVLFLACINFMNLSTAKSDKRAKEVGVRKVVGSTRSGIIAQFLSESLLTTAVAMALALIFAQIGLPFFNSIAQKQIVLPWRSGLFWLMALAFTVFTGIVSGSYPAFYLSSFKPVKVLKGNVNTGHSGITPRQVLVVFQFAVSITLIITALMFSRQINFAKERVAGFDRDRLVTIWLPDQMYFGYDTWKNELLKTGSVSVVARSSMSPAHFPNNNSIEWRGKDPGIPVYFRTVNVSADYGEAIRWTITKGRDFSDERNDSSSVILNETALRITGLKEPIGEIITYDNKEYTIIGIAEDMITQSPYGSTEPAVFFGDGWHGLALLRLAPKKLLSESLSDLETVTKKLFPSTVWGYSFVDGDFSRKFATEERLGSLARFFAIFASSISCLGLLGLSSFVARQRTKEIGIRKILGASVAVVWRMMSLQFLILVLFASVVAVPLAYFFIDRWLQSYEYHTSVSWWIIACTVAGALAISLVMTSIQIVRAATANPVICLKSE